MSSPKAALKPAECENLHLGYKHWLWKMEQYGSAMNCPRYDPPPACGTDDEAVA